jgi:hypothetical protein
MSVCAGAHRNHKVLAEGSLAAADERSDGGLKECGIPVVAASLKWREDGGEPERVLKL